jgi:hypothetical protein
MNNSRYRITVEGNSLHALPVVQMFVELLDVENIVVEYIDNGHFSMKTTPEHWFRVLCVEEKEDA